MKKEKIDNKLLYEKEWIGVKFLFLMFGSMLLALIIYALISTVYPKDGYIQGTSCFLLGVLLFILSIKWHSYAIKKLEGKNSENLKP